MYSKNIALIFAGGHGARMRGTSIPKQFLKVNDKPIIIYTLEKFDEQENIDGIIVVCVKGWELHLKEMINKYNIQKVISIVEGGRTGQLSIENGITEIEKFYGDEVLVLIHDGVRPVISRRLIQKCIDAARIYGNAVSVADATETIMLKTETNINILDRSNCFLIKAPQCFMLSDIKKAHEQAKSDNQTNYIDSACLMSHYGHTLHYVKCSNENLKVTTPADYYMFKALVMEDKVFGDGETNE